MLPGAIDSLKIAAMFASTPKSAASLVGQVPVTTGGELSGPAVVKFELKFACSGTPVASRTPPAPPLTVTVCFVATVNGWFGSSTAVAVAAS